MTDVEAKRSLFREAAVAAREGRPLPPPLPQPDGDMGPPPLATDAALTVERRDATCDCGTAFHQSKLAGLTTWLPVCCDACTDRRLAAEADARYRRLEAEESRQRDERARRMVQALNVRPKYADATVGNFVVHGTPSEAAAQGRVLQLVRRYLGTWPDVAPILAFTGHPGTGKGHMAWAIAREIAATHAVPVQVVKLADLIRRIRATWRKDGEAEEAVLEFYRRQSLLVIDEVSSHAFYGQNVHQHLYDILDDRLEHHRPTILTSNESDEGLAAILRPALWDRLHDGGGVLEFTWGSWRSRERAA